MKRIGIISDTHGTFDGKLREFLRDVDEIWHAGDIGSLALADEIAAFKPLRAVSGNIDGGLTRRVYPDFAEFRCEEVGVLMTHIGGYPRRYDPRALERIRTVQPRLFIAGHSHILKVMFDPAHNLLAVNPGAAGEFGFHRVRTAIRLVIDGADMRDRAGGEWPRRPCPGKQPCRRHDGTLTTKTKGAGLSPAPFFESFLRHATRSRTPWPLSASTTTVSPSWSRPSIIKAESGSSTWSISVRLSDRTP